jgi:hypothetical protein
MALVLSSSIEIFPDVDGIAFVFIRLILLKAVGRDDEQMTHLVDFIKLKGSASINHNQWDDFLNYVVKFK